MKKLILTGVMCIILNRNLMAQCMEDSTRQQVYTSMDVFRYDLKTYEAYRVTPVVSMTVTIKAINKGIYFRDADHNYNLNFYIKDCWMGDSTFTYKCYDIKNKQDCDLVFSAGPTTYNLTVDYPKRISRYRLKVLK